MLEQQFTTIQEQQNMKKEIRTDCRRPLSYRLYLIKR